jgi:hypothetical protein
MPLSNHRWSIQPDSGVFNRTAFLIRKERKPASRNTNTNRCGSGRNTLEINLPLHKSFF